MIRLANPLMTKLPIIPGFLLLLAMTSFTAHGADSLFAPEPSQVTQPSVGADMAAQAKAAAAASSASTPAIVTNPAPSSLLAQNQPSVASQPVSAALGSSTSAATNEPTPKQDTRPAPSKSQQASAKPIPVDQPPNLDQPADKMAASAPSPTAPSENVTLNLINRLVQRGILTKEDAGDLIRQAQDDARNAAQQAQATQQASQQAAAAQQMAVEAAAPPSSDDSVSVSYVPEIVKSEMRDEIKRDVIAAAQSEGWATPNYPSWINNFRPFMDLRTRYQLDTFPGNDTMSNSYENLDTINFNSINTGNPLNMAAIPGPSSQYSATYPNGIFPAPNSYTGYYTQQTPGVNPPTYNTTQQRELMRIRFRFGADMNLGENFTSGFRIGTGQNGSPVSENQTLGAVGTSGQGGNFSSYAIWLDRAFLKYEIGSDPDRLAATL